MSLSLTFRRFSNFSAFPATNSNAACQIRRSLGREGRSFRGKMRVPRCSSLPLSRMFDSRSHGSFHSSLCQIPFILPHASSFFVPQETMLIALSSRTINFRNPPFPCFDLLVRGFCDRNSYSDSEIECEISEDDDRESESRANSIEVDRVCKVLDELFALDRNMEAVLDECGIILSHDLVLNVLERFKQARKPAFRFFCWAAHKPGFSHDSKTYNMMMTILGKTRQFETMVSLLEEMAEKELLTMETFTICFKSFAAAKERRKAIGIFELMKKYKYKVGVETINCLLDSLGRAKLGKEAQAVFEKLCGRFTPNLQTYTVLLNGWCRVRNLMEAGKIWNLMIDEGCKPDIVAHNTMLEGLLRCKKRSDAIKLFEVMKAKGPSPDVKSYTILVRDFCKQNKMKEAVEYFEEMQGAGCRPDTGIYTCLITGFGNQRRMDMIYGILKEMKTNGCPPDGKTYNSLIKLMTNRRMPDDAGRIYNKMIESGIKPTIHTYNMMMKSYFQTRNYEMGVFVWDEMKQKGCCPDDNSYTVFIGGLISHGRCSEAGKYLEEMIEKGMKAPQLDYNKFAADFSRAGRPDILEELAQKLKFSGKFEASNVIARWAEMMRKRVKRRTPRNIVNADHSNRLIHDEHYFSVRP
ncbi:pentatricopeptide repeat-containing protein At3g62470, mitochondrial-like [Cucurbita pepo subsp. pepo]|uniref:pentatricopeptide repeat-containing protein At3g62470, mitochondrial-like n=1 Tax=Cucurbita pepo subsp. pepo TaxID=3664 RepID=UPI000C9D68BD|nr:pentatricopeptide repeat-containing protein At3g62470, mitochondrial-like [Cucurbita pepo subsp. pepo]